MPLKTAGRQKIFSSFRRVTQAAAFIASLCKHYPQICFGINSSVELEPVYWHGYPEIVYPSVSCRHYFRSCPQVIAMEVSFRLCHGLAGKARGGQWSCTDRLYTDWVIESDNLSKITLMCNLSRNEKSTYISSIKSVRSENRNLVYQVKYPCTNQRLFEFRK